WRDLRLQLLRTLAAWLPDKEVGPFLMAVDADADEAPQVRFRAAVLMCERGDPMSLAHLVLRHFEDAKKTKTLLSVESIRKSLQDRQLFDSDKEFDGLKAVGSDEVAGIQKGIQLAQHFYAVRQGEAVRGISVAKVRVHQEKIDSILFRLTTASEGWSFE